MKQTKSAMRNRFFEYAVPSVLAMWVFSFYTMVDGFFVAWGAGPMALAAVNIAMPFVNLIFGLSILCSAGASTVISIYLGRREAGRARQAFMTNGVFLCVLSVAMTIACLVFIDPLVRFLGGTPALFADVKTYLRIIVSFTAFFVVAYYLEVMARADGFPKLAAIAVVVAAAANIVLDYLFVIVMGWGVAGAAYATGIAQALSAILLGVHFAGKRTRLKFGAFRFRFAAVVRGMRLGFGDSITEFSVGAVIFLFNHRILQVIGERGVVSYTVVAYVTTLVVMTMIGIAQGMQPLVASYRGARDTAGCDAMLKLALKSAVICGVIWSLAVKFFAPTFVALFISPSADPVLWESTVDAFELYSLSYAFVGIGVVAATFFSAIERPGYGVVLSLARGVVIVAIVLAVLPEFFGASGIWFAPVVSELICVAVAAALFHKLRADTRPELQNSAERA